MIDRIYSYILRIFNVNPNKIDKVNSIEVRPDKCNSGNIFDKCNDCPISLGNAYHENKIQLLELKISIMQNQIDNLKRQ
jgi:hypothetical protein